MASAAKYQLTGKAVANLKGQQGLVVRALMDGGAQTVAEVAERIKAELVTVQTPERIAAYYVCVLKKSGHVVEVPADAPRTIADIEAELERACRRVDELDAELNAARNAAADAVLDVVEGK
jgi:hypothetical protein